MDDYAASLPIQFALFLFKDPELCWRTQRWAGIAQPVPVGRKTTLNTGYHLAQLTVIVFFWSIWTPNNTATFMGLDPVELTKTDVRSRRGRKEPLPIHSKIHGPTLLHQISTSAAELELVAVLMLKMRHQRCLLSQNTMISFDRLSPSLGIIVLSAVAATHVLVPIQTPVQGFFGLLVNTHWRDGLQG